MNNLSFTSHHSFLATGDSYTGLAARVRLGKPIVHQIINDTCERIWTVLKDEVMPVPTQEDWIRIEKGFRLKWHFPNCIGALDGKHVSIKSTPNSGSLFLFYSTVMVALVDANYWFIHVDIGEYVTNCDSNVFKFSSSGRKFLKNKLNIPDVKRLPDYQQEGPLPHVIVADEYWQCGQNNPSMLLFA